MCDSIYIKNLCVYVFNCFCIKDLFIYYRYTKMIGQSSYFLGNGMERSTEVSYW